jgi:hypothetical protein
LETRLRDDVLTFSGGGRVPSHRSNSAKVRERGEECAKDDILPLLRGPGDIAIGKESAFLSTVDFRPTRSLTADYARLSRFLLNNAPGSEMSYFAAATHMDEKLPFEQITLAQLLPADKHSLWQS